MKLSPGTAIRIWLVLLFGTVVFGSIYNLRLISHPFYQPTPVDSPDQPLRFVIVSPQYDHPFWQEVYTAATRTGERLRVTIEYQGPRRAALDEQVRLLDMVTAAQVDGIITQGVPDEAVATAIAKAVDRGIPVITVGTDLPGRRLAYVGSDNYLAGKQAGTELVRRTKGQAVVGILRGDFGPESEDLRLQGFRDALIGQPGIRIVATAPSGLNRTVAMQKAWEILRDHPEVNVLYGTTALDLIGIAQAVRSPEWRDRILVMGWDVTSETLEYMAPGLIELAVEQDMQAMGSRAVEALEAYLRRDERPSKRLHTPFNLRQGGGTP